MRSWKETVMDRRKAGKIAGVALAGTLFVAGGTFLAANQFQNGREIVVANKENTLLTTSTPDLGQNNSVTAEKVAVKQKETITIHYKWKGKQPHLYYQVDKTGAKTSYPGVPMKDEGNGWYTYSVTNAEAANLKISVPSLDYQTSEFSRDAGEYWYDDEKGWSLSAPANYTTPKDKEVVVDGKTLAATGNIVVHFPISEMKDANIYYWNVLPTDMETDWPGETMSEKEKYYTYSFTATSKVNFLFTNGSEQTEDFTLKKAGEYWYADGKWVTTEPETTKPEETPTVSATPSVTAAPHDNSEDFREETIYFLMTTRFYDGDSSNNAYSDHDYDEPHNDKNNDPSWRGDFKGLIEKLDYIKALGFSAIWITPVVENRSGYDYHGYHAYNFSEVDSRYTSDGRNGMDAYQELINACHEKGLKIIQDIVLNHTGKWGEKNLLDLDSIEDWRTRDLVVMNGTGDPDNIYHHNQFLDAGQFDGYDAQIGSIAGDCYDLETENPVVSKYLSDTYCKYIKMGVDGFRIDTVKHISRLTFNKEFIPAFQKAGGENFFMFGEVCVRNNSVYPAGEKKTVGISVPFYSWKEDKEYSWGDLATNEASVKALYDENDASNQRTSDNAFLDGNKYHTPDHSEYSGMSAIDFYMHWGFKKASEAFDRGLKEDYAFNDSTYNVMYVDSHDYGPDSMQRFNEGTQAWAENMDLMWTFRGIPCLYYGSEIEFKAGKAVDDYYQPLENTGRAYFGDHIEGSVDTTDYGVYSGATGAMAETLNYPLAKHVQRLNLIRRAVPALQKGQYAKCDGNMAYKRRYTDSSKKIDSYVLVTISGDATFKDVLNGKYVELITGKTVDVSNNTLVSSDGIGAANMRVYVYQNETATAYGATGKIGEDGMYLKN